MRTCISGKYLRECGKCAIEKRLWVNGITWKIKENKKVRSYIGLEVVGKNA